MTKFKTLQEQVKALQRLNANQADMLTELRDKKYKADQQMQTMAVNLRQVERQRDELEATVKRQDDRLAIMAREDEAALRRRDDTIKRLRAVAHHAIDQVSDGDPNRRPIQSERFRFADQAGQPILHTGV